MISSLSAFKPLRILTFKISISVNNSIQNKASSASSSTIESFEINSATDLERHAALFCSNGCARTKQLVTYQSSFPIIWQFSAKFYNILSEFFSPIF